MRTMKNFLPLMIVIIWGFISLGQNNFAFSAENTLTIERFPAQVGNSWEYRRTFYTVVYDTVHNDTTEILLLDSLHCEFQAIDTIRDWGCYRYFSQLFELGKTYSDTVWYAHPDTAFLEIAYGPPRSAGPPWKVNGKYKLKLGERYFNSTEELNRYLFQIRNFSYKGFEAETTFWEPPKKLFVFPLSVGRSWISMTDPWLDERIVTEESFTVVPGGSFLTLKIEIRYNILNLVLFEWIADNGIVKCSLYVSGLATDEYGEIIGFFEGDDKYELLDYKTDVKESIVENSIPKNFSLEQNYPNPFNPTTKIQFKVGSLEFGEPIHTTLKIYNILGQLVKTLVDEEKLPGNYNIIWDGKDNSGRDVTSGIYFYQLKTKDYTDKKKMVLLR